MATKIDHKDRLPNQAVSEETRAAIKKALPEALLRNPGNLDAAAREVGITTTTLNRWRSEDDDFAQIVDDARNVWHGKIAGGLYQQALDGQLTAAIFVSKAQMGWSDRQAIDHKVHIEYADGSSAGKDQAPSEISPPVLSIVSGGGSKEEDGDDN